MALLFRELHKANSPELPNEEWLLLENTGPNVLTAHKRNVIGAQRPTVRRAAVNRFGQPPDMGERAKPESALRFRRADEKVARRKQPVDGDEIVRQPTLLAGRWHIQTSS